MRTAAQLEAEAADGWRDSAEGRDKPRMRAAGGVAVTEVTATTRKVEIMRGDWGSMWIGEREARDFESPCLGASDGKVSVCQWRHC